eukprot:CAMPEP_0175858832 /NCGR_PEP_ID=MMETSP0107_2-20121207/29889_1 /TAXON_ID=195067 ORGANISM="Goniomonas pacifica, Strain CCMP1869" /NCGR_SAMPLE_ID=MMETSP0107_2 /ASSEMBLY_ACC=CAM_ASM_000203 /LENGTH=31 /DNA_ID= /DNA_START= /DNA_END= /DNA_ORIENTATION=
MEWGGDVGQGFDWGRLKKKTLAAPWHPKKQK